MADINVKIVGPGDDPVDAKVLDREQVPAYRGKQRSQISDVNAGKPGPDRRGGIYRQTRSSGDPHNK